MMPKEIDFVVTWVNGQDEAWQKRRARYTPEENTDNRECRYQDYGLLPYWFRGVEIFAPWVRMIHFVTEGHLPEWLNTENSKLHIVKHEDYIPKEFLPTFNSNIIELWIHNIKGLSEQFVYFNDDFFLTKPVQPGDFFLNGKPCDLLAFQPIVANPSSPVMSHLYLNDILTLCKYFDKRKEVAKHPADYFHIGYPPLYFFYNILEMVFPLYTGMYTVHGPYPLLKSTYQKIWGLEKENFLKISANRFRSNMDITIRLFREWQKLSGNFHPQNIKRNSGYYGIPNDKQKLIRAIQFQKKKVLCINDVHSDGENMDQIAKEIQEAFQRILPKKSSFEK